MSVELFTENERKLSIRTRRSRLSPRTFHSAGRQTVFIDGFVGVNGIPTSSEGGAEAKREETRRIRMKLREFIEEHFICIVYLVFCVIMGAIWQGWI